MDGRWMVSDSKLVGVIAKMATAMASTKRTLDDYETALRAHLRGIGVRSEMFLVAGARREHGEVASGRKAFAMAKSNKRQPPPLVATG